jgi:hypothetical protein
MADVEQLVPGIDWRKFWSFAHLFRSFRLAVHPSKLALGLALLLSIGLGGLVLDSLWPAKYRAVSGEVNLYETAPSTSAFELSRSMIPDNQGIFRAFFDYESHEFTGVVNSVLANEWITSPTTSGVARHTYNFLLIGPLWLTRAHPLFAILFAILLLSSWSLFGGAIARLAAVHVACDEKIPVRRALNFALGKFLSFASAPLIPALIVLVVGLLLGLASLVVGNIPYVGPIVVGGGFFLALLAGLVQTLVILGAVGGFNLMYPTIAVEGSDSFDAISRSFSYVYARPWRMLFYTIVALAYGALTYLFVRYFILLMLVLAHHFVSIGMFGNDANHRPVLASMWPSPAATGRLIYRPNYSALNWGQAIGAGLLSFWIYLIIGCLGAFAISFYFTASTIIYYLMRRDLDSTEMDEVFLEQSDEDYVAASVTSVEAVIIEGGVEAPPGA